MVGLGVVQTVSGAVIKLPEISKAVIAGVEGIERGLKRSARNGIKGGGELTYGITQVEDIREDQSVTTAQIVDHYQFHVKNTKRIGMENIHTTSSLVITIIPL